MRQRHGRRCANRDRHTTQTTSQETTAPAPADGDAILIETRVRDVKHHKTDVVDFVVGEARRCPAGKGTGGSDGPTITSTFHCRGGTLTVRYAPTQYSLVQGAPWEIVSGTGSFKTLRGGGSMVAEFHDRDHGREVFTGTVNK